MSRWIIALFLCIASATCQSANSMEEDLLDRFLECDASISTFLQRHADALSKYAGTEEVRPELRWFRTDADTSYGERYVTLKAPMKIGTVTAVAAAYWRSTDTPTADAEFWGLYFKEDIRTVLRALQSHSVIREMKYINVDGEHYARLRIVNINGRPVELVNILEPAADTPFNAASYLSCSIQPQQ